MPDAGTLVNTTQNFVNAYDGTTIAFDANNTFAPGMVKFYAPVMLDNARDNLVLTDLGRKESLPMNNGVIMEWQRFNTLPDPDRLVEGVIPVGKKWGMKSVTVELVQEGLYVALTDRQMAHNKQKVVVGAVEETGASLGRGNEKLTRAALQLGTNVLFADKVNLTTADKLVVGAVTSRAALNTAAATATYMTADTVAQAATILDASNTPFHSANEYVMAIHPHVAYDIRTSKGWVDVKTYSDPDDLYTNEIGMLSGVRFVKSTLCPIIKGANLTAAARNLTVKTGGVTSNATIPVTEAITAGEATALVGRKVIIAGVVYVIESASAAVAGSATITVDAAVTANAAVVIYPGEGGAEGTAIYQSFMFGKDAFAVVEPDGMSLETIIHGKESGIGGPLNQFSTVGGKYSGAAKILYQERMVVIESTSKYSTSAQAN